MKHSIPPPWFASFGIGLCLALIGRSAAQAEGSLSNLDIEYSEARVTIGKVLEDNSQLRQALAESQKILAEMRKYLAASSGENEIFKRYAADLKLRMDALGLGSGTAQSPKVEQRLLSAVSDLRLVSEENRRLAEALTRLSEASSLYAKTATTTNAEARLCLEGEVRNANLALANAGPHAMEAAAVPSSISDGLVISVKSELSAIVMNIGAKQGVKVGMPFHVLRKQQIVGSVRVVDVREKIAGAVIQDLSAKTDQVNVGDHLKVDAR